jgi:hypothetical protein
MLGRIDELEASLFGLRERAVAEQWTEEIDGIGPASPLLRSKHEETRRLAPDSPSTSASPRPEPPHQHGRPHLIPLIRENRMHPCHR